MNRALVFGIAIFFAVVGIALLGADKTAYAGHGCHGCSCDGGCDSSCDSSCSSSCDCSCSGRKRLFHRHRCHGRRRCHGCSGCSVTVSDCCCTPAPCSGSDCGGAPAEEAAPEEEPATEAPAPMASAPSYERSQFGFRTVNFRR